MTADYLVPPSSVEAEQCVIGGIMLDAQSDRAQKIFSFLKPEAFYNRQHAVVYRAMLNMNAQHQTVDLLTVSENLESSGDIDLVGGFAYLAELSKNTPAAANIIAYANVVREKAMERYAIEQANKALEILYARNGMTTAEKLEHYQSLAMQLADKSRSGNTKGLIPFRDAFNEWTDKVGERFEGDSSSIGITSGIPALDELLEPKRIVRGSLFVIGARPKMGKTTVYQHMAIHCAVEEKLPALAFSLEMPKDQMVERIVSQHSKVNSNVFYLNGYDESKFALALAKGGEIANTNNLYIDDTPGLSLSHIVSESRRIKRERGDIGMILVDYLTLMTAEKADTEAQAYGIITKGLKVLAKEINCVVVLLTQLNRGSEARANKRPVPSDSRSTGQIEQDCDYWLGIYREAEDNEGVCDSETELILRLNRHGSSGTVYAEQRNGILYDVDQQMAQMRISERKERTASKRNGF
ncbi:DnaB-like helicase C-terminal domain-containing protein [Pectobacterium parmentieri]|uniref:DnaB-like helicase C-terminal domain-containing protein n=1 Tax=Pectobacterium parmentieri TaxID=1905730 RepID=UPI000F8D7BCE|nr:DnaB-like helicase C-terminal domain-containing protein [Pectobacterium parmentieri]AZS56760.1 helicase DnaB [Pectobacterium parmentieri]MBI0431667.1 AAA family ATPase [Pectobacterium parmentieri]